MFSSCRIVSSYLIKLGKMFDICNHFVHVNKVNTISSFKPKLSNSKAEADFPSQITAVPILRTILGNKNV